MLCNLRAVDSRAFRFDILPVPRIKATELLVISRPKMFQLFVFLSALSACSLIESNHAEALIVTLPLYNQTEPSLDNVPDFLRETYECWSTERSLKYCIPYSQGNGSTFGDINTIRAVTGSGESAIMMQ